MSAPVLAGGWGGNPGPGLRSFRDGMGRTATAGVCVPAAPGDVGRYESEAGPYSSLLFISSVAMALETITSASSRMSGWSAR